MKRINIFSIALIGSLALLSTACINKEITDDPLGLVGKPIVFSASTTYDNGVETKAEYSGDLIGTTSKTERIDWKADDPIKIVYGNNASGYTVTANGTASGKDSKASISGGNLVWASGSTHKFYARYPNRTPGDVTTAGVFSGTIPASQSVTSNTLSPTPSDCDIKYQPNTHDYGYMFGYLSLNATAATVEIPFKPAFTTLEFKLKRKAGDADKKIKTIQVSTSDAGASATPLTGDFEFTIPNALTLPASNDITTRNTGNTITLDFTGFTGGGVSIPADKFLDFSVLALPVNQKYVKVVFTYTDNTTKKLSLKDLSGNWIEFTGGLKYIITNDNVPGSEVWTYYVEDIANINTYGHLATSNLPFTVKSYRKNGAGTYEPVKWKVQYSVDGNSWSDTQPSGWQTGGAKFSITNTTGNGCNGPSAAGVVNYANILRDHNTSSSEYETNGAIDDTQQAAIATMKSRGTLPSTTSDAGDGYFDLSKHPIYPVSAIDGAETTQETANCYVITRPGKYKFPLVYGNAINYNASTATSGNNTMAYDPQNGQNGGNNINYYLRRFVRHDDKPITDPWIHNNGFTVADAVVVWQDVPDASMQILLDSDISISNNYVKFQIREANIRPGNILIAARNSSGTILWSWHLWVTEKDLGPHTVVDGAGNTLQMMNFNLGWTDKVSGHGEHWVDWPFYVRIIQTDASGNILNNTNPQNVDSTGAADVFCVTQWGESISVKGNVGSNTFYQWGRKDPLLPAASNNTNKSIYSAAYSLSSIIDYSVTNSGEYYKVITTRDDNGTIGKSIQTPYNIFYSRQSQTIGTQGGNVTNSNHMFIGKATDNNGGTLAGAAWYGNLWDTGLIAHIGSSTTANAVNVNDRQPIKSVYDPSPRGYVVPYIFAFTGFSTAAYNTTNAGTPRGSLSSDGEGYNFNDGNGSTIFLPFAGARGGDGANPLYDVNATMYYWTTGKLPWDDKWGSNHKSKRMAFFRDGHLVQPLGPEIYGQSDEYSEGAYSIRPVLQTAF